MMISRCIRYCMAALAMCFGTFAFASDDFKTGFGYSDYLSFHTASAFKSGGAYGADYALFNARQAYMADAERTELAGSGNLMKDSHGFMQAAAYEVAKGTTGSTVESFKV